MQRTKAGLTLEKMLFGMKNRYLLCWGGEDKDAAYDCGCCMAHNHIILHSCGCICHERIEEMSKANNMAFFLQTAESLDLVPQADWFTAPRDRENEKPVEDGEL